MANPAVTYTFSNGTTADATQVNTNFTDLINSLTDSTKSLAIDALTCAGAATFNGAVTLGNGTPDDITFTGSLASTIPIKTNASFNFGSATLGLASVYLGSAGGLTTRLVGGATGSSWTLTFPTTDGNSREYLETNGSGVTTWVPIRRTAGHASNYSLVCGVGSNALTIELKGLDGNDASATNPIDILFRNSVAATGTPVVRTLTTAASVVLSSGSTLGHASAANHYIYVYAYDDAGTVKIAVSSALFDDGTIVAAITAEGGAGGATSGSAIYATAAATNVPVRLIGRIKSNQTTAGTWAALPTEIAIPPFNSEPVQIRVGAGSTAFNNGTGDTVAVFSTKTIDNTNSYNSSTGIFTAPRPGNYLVRGKLQYAAATAAGVGSYYYLKIRHNSSIVCTRTMFAVVTASQPRDAEVTDLLSLATGDTVAIIGNQQFYAGNVAMTSSTADSNFMITQVR